MKKFPIALTLALALTFSGCASGISYSKVETELPTLATNQGRIYIYTPIRNFALNFQPEVLVNGASVGQSHSGTFLVVDQAAGEYRIVAAKQASFSAFSGQQNSVPASISLTAGSSAYVRMQIENEQLAIRAAAIPMSLEEGQREVRRLRYRGGNALSSGN